MKAGLRFGLAYLAAALALAPTAALAQQAPATTTEARPSDIPATDAVGPRDLQNFNLSGRVTRQADRPVAVEPVARQDRTGTASPTATPSAAASSTTPAPTRATTNERPRPAEVASTDNPAPERSPEPTGRSEPGLSVTAPLPQLGGPPASATDTIAPSPRFATAAAAPTNLAPEHSFGMLPWLLAAIALGGGAIFLFWRSRSREAFAGGPRADAFEAPEPAPRAQPRPAPAPRAPAPAPTPTPSIPGTVSTRLRPWIEIGFQPLRCIVDDSQVVIEFEAELLNSGSAAARAVLAEASLFNAGPTQDQDLGAFFANPVGAGERIVEIGPLKRISLRSQVVIPLANVQRYELAGKQVFVPVIAFNALYRWSSGEGQTSVSYLLGRDTQSDKLGPFRLDLGPRVFRGLAARPLQIGVRQ